MRIAFNTLIENPRIPSGSLDFYMQITRELARLDHENEYYLLVSAANRRFFDIDADNVHLLNCFVSNEKPMLRIFISQFIIPFYLLQNKIDLLFSPQNLSALYIPKRTKSIISIIAAQHWKIPENIGKLRSFYRTFISRFARQQAAVIVATSDNTKKDICENLSLPSEKVTVIYEGLDHNRFYPAKLTVDELRELSHLDISQPYILFVSTIWRYKNVHTLIEAYGKLIQETKIGHQLVLVGRIHSIEGGRNYLNGLLVICDKYQIRERVRFVGQFLNEKVAFFYRGADLYVQPSIYETFGKTITEAFACGVPVIASNTSATPEVVGDAGILFDPDSAEDMKDAMKKTLFDPLLRAELVKKGLQRASLFSFTKQAEELIALFNKTGAQ